MALRTLFIVLSLSLASFVAAAGPHDAGLIVRGNNRAAHRLARSRRGRAAAGRKRELAKRQKEEECTLEMSAQDAAQWTSFIGTGFRECTTSVAQLGQGVAMCYRLGFVDTTTGTFGGELTVWDVTGGSTSSSSNATVESFNGTTTSARSRSSTIATSTTLSAASASVTDVSNSTSGRLARRATDESFEVVMTIGKSQYRTGQITLAAENEKALNKVKEAVSPEGNRTTVRLANLQFSRQGMELVQSYHFVGAIPGFKVAKAVNTTSVERGNTTTSSKEESNSTKSKNEKRQDNGINLDLSFEGVAGRNDSAKATSSAVGSTAFNASSTLARATRTSSSVVATATAVANETLSEPISADILSAIAPRLQVVADSAARGVASPILIDLSKDDARSNGFATKPFGGFLALSEAGDERRSKEGVTALIADGDCSIVIGGDPADSNIPAAVFATTTFGSFFSSATSTSAASTTPSSVAATSSSSAVVSIAAVSESASPAPTATSDGLPTSAVSIVAGNPSSGPGIQVISTGAIAASEAEAFSVAAAPTSVEPAVVTPAADPSPTSVSESTDANGAPLADATAASAAADPSATAFQLPGRSISVLPIGLGVFGGVSAVALVIVGWVTYERKKYKKMFADRQAQQSRFVPRAGYGTV